MAILAATVRFLWLVIRAAAQLLYQHLEAAAEPQPQVVVVVAAAAALCQLESQLSAPSARPAALPRAALQLLELLVILLPMEAAAVQLAPPLAQLVDFPIGAVPVADLVKTVLVPVQMVVVTAIMVVLAAAAQQTLEQLALVAHRCLADKDQQAP
jgi:hypothetical protein